MVLAEGSKRHEWHVSIDMCYYIEPFLFIFQFHLVLTKTQRGTNGLTTSDPTADGTAKW